MFIATEKNKELLRKIKESGLVWFKSDNNTLSMMDWTVMDRGILYSQINRIEKKYSYWLSIEAPGFYQIILYNRYNEKTAKVSPENLDKFFLSYTIFYAKIFL